MADHGDRRWARPVAQFGELCICSAHRSHVDCLVDETYRCPCIPASDAPAEDEQ